MVEYKITLSNPIRDCYNCPLRSELMYHENLDYRRREVLTGTVSITRRESICNLTQEKIDMPQAVGEYGTKCPLQLGKEVV